MRLSALLFGLAVTLAASGAWAQEAVSTREDAGLLFQRGTAAYAAGDYAAAAREFEQAYRLRPHAAALFNRARALELLGDAPRAADCYVEALSRGELREQDRAEAESRLASLSKTLGSVRVEGPQGTRGSIGHLENAPLPISAHLAAGRYQLVVVARNGQATEFPLLIAAGKPTRLNIESQPPTKTPGPRNASDERSHFRVPPSALVALGGGLLFAGAGTYLGLAGLAARDEFDESRHTDVAAHDRAIHFRTWANVAFGVAAAAGALGGVLIYRASTQRAQVTLQADPRERGCVLLGISARL